MNTTAVRVRFAPSPTGPLHIGSVRTALFNWLFARHHNGTYLLRVEDTDRVRSTPEFLQAQLNALSWLGIEADEEPTIQSSGLARHQEVMDQLVARDVLYEKEGALWFRVPTDVESVSFTDLIRGKITVPLNTVDDFVVRRSDGSPIYNFCVVVDDQDMAITHVIRGEDHISNTIKQLLLYEVFGWQAPQFAHLPLIVNSAGAPLSKRDGITDVDRYKQAGYLSDALLNYLVRLGWAHGDQEIFSREEMMQLFSLGGVGKKAAVFDADKLSWVNQQHLMKRSAKELVNELIALELAPSESTTILGMPSVQAEAYIELYKARAVTLTALADAVTQLAHAPASTTLPNEAPWLTPNTGRLLHQFVQAIQDTTSWDKQTLLAAGRQVVGAANVGLAQLGQPLRFALVGSTSSPGIFDIMAIMGRDESMARIHNLEELLRSSS